MIDLIIIILAGMVLLFLLSCCFMVARLLDEEIAMYGLEISVIEFLDIEIENEADLIAMLKKISPFFKWDGLLHVLEGEKFL